MQLTSEEQAMLRGDQGAAVKEALEYLIKVGEFWGAQRMVPITNAHMMGDIEVMGDAGLVLARGVRTAAPGPGSRHAPMRAASTSTGPSASGQDRRRSAEGTQRHRLLQAMNMITTDTCINYQTLYQPHLGERVAWGDTGTVIYANSVFGARTQFRERAGGARRRRDRTGARIRLPTRPAPARRPSSVDAARPTLDDLADWGAVGQDRRRAPSRATTRCPCSPASTARRPADELKHLGARARELRLDGRCSTWSGVTPEAPSVEAALGGNRPHTDDGRHDARPRARVRRLRPRGPGAAISSSSPGRSSRCSRSRRSSERFDGRRHVHGHAASSSPAATACSPAARRLGYLAPLEAAGVDGPRRASASTSCRTCRRCGTRNGWTNMISNSREDREHHRRASLQHHPAPDAGLRATSP